MEHLRFVNATAREHFSAMSLIHALGWRTTYQDAVPADFMAENVTDDHWTVPFETDFLEKRCQGILLYRDDVPVACATYGAARVNTPQNDGNLCHFSSAGYEGWAEVMSFYTHPDEKHKGYGRALMEEILRRLKAEGYRQVYVLVLRENENARHFYTACGFAHDGTEEKIPFPDGTICVDLRYTRVL
ncbi:MAG: GNAT family N-acetyltransferase [Oscillospiraceae bacterium]